METPITYPTSCTLDANAAICGPTTLITIDTARQHSKIYENRTDGLHPPDVNPYKTLKTATPAVVFIPNTAKTSTPFIKQMGVLTFRWPYLSARTLGMIRPNVEAAFRIDSYKDIVGLKPQQRNSNTDQLTV